MKRFSIRNSEKAIIILKFIEDGLANVQRHFGQGSSCLALKSSVEALCWVFDTCSLLLAKS